MVLLFRFDTVARDGRCFGSMPRGTLRSLSSPHTLKYPRRKVYHVSRLTDITCSHSAALFCSFHLMIVFRGFVSVWCSREWGGVGAIAGVRNRSPTRCDGHFTFPPQDLTFSDPDVRRTPGGRRKFFFSFESQHLIHHLQILRNYYPPKTTPLGTSPGDCTLFSPFYS